MESSPTVFTTSKKHFLFSQIFVSPPSFNFRRILMHQKCIIAHQKFEEFALVILKEKDMKMIWKEFHQMQKWIEIYYKTSFFWVFINKKSRYFCFLLNYKLNHIFVYNKTTPKSLIKTFDADYKWGLILFWKVQRYTSFFRWDCSYYSIRSWLISAYI